MAVKTSRHLPRSAMGVFPPSRAAAMAAAKASTAALKAAASTGGLGNAGLPNKPARIAVTRESSTASSNLENPSWGRICVTLDITNSFSIWLKG